MSRATAVGFGSLFQAGWSALRGYWRLAIAVYAVQLLIAAGAAAVMARMLASVFAHYPIFDEAVDGSAFALAMVVLRNPELFLQLMWVGLAAVALYVVVSWYLVGGLIAVYLERPEVSSASVFGAGGARSFFAFARLALWCIVPYGVGFVALAMGLAAAGDAMEEALTFGEVLRSLVGGLAPGAAVVAITFAAVDYARIDLARHPAQSSLRALGRGYRMIFSGWRPFAHVACYYVAIAVVSTIYVMATFDQPLGAMALLLMRQLVSVLRFAAKLVLVAGQVSLAQHMRPPSPRGWRLRSARQAPDVA